MANFTQIDYDREMAFIATAHGETGNSETLGEVRTITSPDKNTAEVSIVVGSDLKRYGLGRKLMEKMIDYCRSRGILKLIGQVLKENSAALALLDDLGFQRRNIPGEPQLYEVWINLNSTHSQRTRAVKQRFSDPDLA